MNIQNSAPMTFFGKNVVKIWGVSLIFLLLVAANPAWAATYQIDSSAGVATTYPWIDISTTGTTLALTDDSMSSPIPIGFTFPFGGIGITNITIGSNGWQFFSTGATLYVNADFPVGQELLTLPYWDDLNPRGVATYIRYQSTGSTPNRVFVVSYLNVPHYCNSGTGCTANQTTTLRETFQVQYHEASGDIIFWYQTMSTLGGGWTSGPVPAGGLPEPGATIGLEIGDTDFSRWSYNTNSITNGKALRFYYTTPYTTPSPYAWYQMDETTWGTVTDSSGNGRNGTKLGTATPTGYPPSTPPGSAKTGTPGTCGSGGIPITTGTQGVDTGFDLNNVGNSGSITFWYNSNAAWNDGNNRMLLDASNDLGNNDNTDRQFYLVKTNTGSLQFSLEDSANTESRTATANSSFAANTWHHIVVTWNLGMDRIRIYLDGTLSATSTTNVNGTLGDMLSLYLGDQRGGTISGVTGKYTTNSANGYIDEVRIYNTELTIQDVFADKGRTHSCGSTLHHFTITVGSSASTCTPQTVTITAYDAAGTVLTGYTGTVNISTSTNHGDWSQTTVTGILNNGITDDGAAAYTFVAGDSGTKSLALDNHHTDNLTITVQDGTVTTTSGQVTFSDNAFVITPTTSTGGVANNTEIVAGRNHGFRVEMWRKNPGTGNCAIAPGYNGAKNLDGWLTLDALNPGGTAPTIGGTSLPSAAPAANPASNNLANISFTNGTANITLSTTDVGKYILNLRDDTRTFAGATDISGASDSLVVRPFGLGFTNINKGGTNNPGGTASAGTAFVAAGDTFAATVGGYLWAAADDANNDGIPDTGVDITDNGLTPHFAYGTALTSTIHTPAGGANGTLSGTIPVPQANFSGGKATVSDLAWDQVGSLYLNANATNYLGVTGVNLTGRSPAVGRVYPHHFTLASSSVTAACNGFTYMGQSLPLIAYTLQAEKLGSGVTSNYDNNTLVYTLVATPALVVENNNAGVNLASRITTSSSPKWIAGQYVFSDSSAIFARATPPTPDGHYDSLQLGVNTSGGDGALIQNLDMRATTTGDCTTIPNCDAKQLGTATKIRYGRLRSLNAYGPETGTIIMPVHMEHYNGTTFVRNVLDNCTTLPAANCAAVSNYQLNNTQESNQLDCTIAIGTGTTTLSVNPIFGIASAGIAKLAFSPPGPGNTGYADLTALIATSLPWLQYEWDGADNDYNENPTGRANFGIYRGNDRIINWREIIR